jgi:hypothetical protein
MHLTLKKEATKPTAPNFLQQQARFDDFMEVFNGERPHEALDMKCPAEVYQPSSRPYQKCYLLGCTPQVRQLAIVTLAARLNLLFKSTLSFENHP